MLFDVAAVPEDSGEPESRTGDVGDSVELLPSGGLEIGLPSRDGRMRDAGMGPP